MSKKVDLRKEARGRMCAVRLPSVCNHNPETTVLAHIRRGGVAGVGQKPPDVCGVWACSDCHDVIDGRVPLHNVSWYEMESDGWTADLALRSDILDALCRTLATLAREKKL